MRKLYDCDNVHQRRRKQQLQQLSDRCADNGTHRRFKGIGAVLSKYAAAKNYKHDEFSQKIRAHTDCNEQQKQLTQLTKCAKMSEENGMIKNGSLNGVGIARSISQNLTNFSTFTISPSTTTTTTPPPLPPPPTTTTTTTASASATTSPTTGTSNSLANSISNSNNNSVRANNESTANGHGGVAGGGGGGGSGSVAGVDTSNSDFGDQKPTNNNNGNSGAHPNAAGGRLQFFKGKQTESKTLFYSKYSMAQAMKSHLISHTLQHTHTHATNGSAARRVTEF